MKRGGNFNSQLEANKYLKRGAGYGGGYKSSISPGRIRTNSKATISNRPVNESIKDMIKRHLKEKKLRPDQLMDIEIFFKEIKNKNQDLEDVQDK